MSQNFNKRKVFFRKGADICISYARIMTAGIPLNSELLSLIILHLHPIVTREKLRPEGKSVKN
jgi:hypothetical protein